MLLPILLANLRTGNPALDAVLTSLLLAMVAHLPQVKAWLMSRYTAKVLDPEYTTVSVYRVIQVTTYGSINELYVVLLDRLSSCMCQTPTGSMEMTMGRPNPKAIPARSQRQAFTWTDELDTEHTIHWSLEYEDKDKDGNKFHRHDERIVMSCVNGDALVAFVKECQDEYTDRTSRVAWFPSHHVWKKMGESRGWMKCPVASKRTFDTVALDSKTKAALMQDIQTFKDSERWYLDMGLDWKRGYLLHGPPGTGKTSIIRALACMVEAPTYALNLNDILDDNDLTAAFEGLPKQCVLIFEDIDCMSRMTHARCPAQTTLLTDDASTASTASTASSAASSAASSDTHASAVSSDLKCKSFFEGPTLSALLNLMDGVRGVHGRITVMTSNHPEVLDPALVRPGRVDLKIELGLCTREMLDVMYDMFYPGMPAPKVPLPANKLSPATVSSAYLTHRNDPDAAHACILAQ